MRGKRDAGRRPQAGRQEAEAMVCACDHRDCWFIFESREEGIPKYCPDCGSRSVRPATEEETAWFFREHRDAEKAG